MVTNDSWFFFFLTGYFTFGPVSIEVGTSTNECSIGLVRNCVVEVEVMYVPHLPPLLLSRRLDQESHCEA